MSGENLVDWYASQIEWSDEIELEDTLKDSLKESHQNVLDKIRKKALAGDKRTPTEAQKAVIRNLFGNSSDDMIDQMDTYGFGSEIEDAFKREAKSRINTELNKSDYKELELEDSEKDEIVNEVYSEDISLDEIPSKVMESDKLSGREAEMSINTQISEEIAEYEEKLQPYRDMDEEELKDRYELGNAEERELAGVVLKEVSPNSLRSKKGWEKGLRSKKNQEAFQSLFN